MGRRLGRTLLHAAQSRQRLGVCEAPGDKDQRDGDRRREALPRSAQSGPAREGRGE